jgi:hypothetical protein
MKLRKMKRNDQENKQTHWGRINKKEEEKNYGKEGRD